MPDDKAAVTPEQEAQLRRLLADARHDEPIPVDVAARLDRVLHQLASEGPDTWPGADVVDLAARRRRRVTGLLVAAAAVVVVGVGVAKVVGTRDGGADSSAAGSAAQDRSSASDESQAESDSSQPPLVGAPTSKGTLGDVPVKPVRVGSKTFAADVLRYQHRRGVASGGESISGPGILTLAPGFACEPADWGVGRLLAAYYDGTPAVLAYRARTGDTQAVDLLQCGSGDLLRSTVLRMP